MTNIKVLGTLFLTFLFIRQESRCGAVELNYPLDAYHVLQLIHSKGFSVMTFTPGEERQTTKKGSSLVTLANRDAETCLSMAQHNARKL